MNKSRNLIVSFSNDIPRCSGIMTLGFVQTHFGNLYPDNEVSILVQEVSKTDGSVTTLCERIKGKWTEVND